MTSLERAAPFLSVRTLASLERAAPFLSVRTLASLERAAPFLSVRTLASLERADGPGVMIRWRDWATAMVTDREG